MSQDRIDREMLEDGDVSVSVLSLGAIMQDWRVPLNGTRIPVILGFETAEAYRHNPAYMGAIVGRVANRIGGGRFTQGGQLYDLNRNDGPHTLHGGAGGLSHVIWQMERDGPNALRLCYLSEHGEMGFPGQVRFQIIIRLSNHRVSWDMKATVDRPTPISLAQHNYYCLTGASALTGHNLRVHADHMLDRDDQGIMTGRIKPLTNTPMDLRQSRELEGPPAPFVADDYYLFATPGDLEHPVAQITTERGLCLRMWSDQPGAQVYTGHWMAPTDNGHGQTGMGPRSGLCIEPSGFPNAPNIPDFPSIIATPDRPYQQHLSVEIR